jgi:hypothetical protein
VPFLAPEERRDGELLLRAWRPGNGEELNRATVESYEHLRQFMAWPSPDTTVEDSEGYARESKARWLLGEDWSLGAWRGERLVGRLRVPAPQRPASLADRRVNVPAGLVAARPEREDDPARPGRRCPGRPRTSPAGEA